MNLRNKWCAGLLLAFVVLAGAPTAFSQATTGTISGTVEDVQGGAVVGATVTVRNLDTNMSRSLQTGTDGRFRFPGLPVGPYELTVEHTGFGKYVRGPIVLLLNQDAVVNPALKPAAVTETITVTEDASILNTSNAEVGVRFDERRITDLPISGQFGSGGGFRDVFSLALGAPGVSQVNAGNSAFTTGTNYSVNGMRLRSNTFLIDGQDSNDPSITGRQQVINNTDIVKEFRLITNQFDSEYGRAAGAVVQVITKSGTNEYHGTAFWYHNDNKLNALSNTDKAAGRTEAPFRIENQFGGTFGGPILKDRTFFFGSIQRWTDRSLGSGTTISSVPTAAGRALLQSTVGTRPQVAALLSNLPAAQTAGTATAAYCVGGGTLPACTGGTRVNIPLGSLTGSSSSPFDDWQFSLRVDQKITDKHNFGGRYLYNDSAVSGSGQATPSDPRLTTDNLARQQAMVAFLTSNFTSRTLNDLRLSWQRLASNTIGTDPRALAIPSLEITPLGLTGFNAAATRTALGLAVNIPQFRFNNTYQIQDTFAWTRGAHAIKFGIDFRRIDVQSFFFPTNRGLLRYSGTALADGTANLQNFVDDIAEAANINKPLPGGTIINNYRWYDYFFFVQDTWQIHPTFSLNYGIRYETPGMFLDSLVDLNKSIVAANGNNSAFALAPVPERDKNNWQPRLGFSWNPRTRNEGWMGWLTGGNNLVLRGGYSRTNDYAFLNIALNIASAFPFVAAINNTNLANAFTALANVQPNLSTPNLLTRTIVGADFRSPVAEQFSFEVQRAFASNYSLRVGYIGTKGTALFQTVDGNPRTQCNPIPATRSATTGVFTISGCPRVDPTSGVIRLRANAASSTYHSMQVQFERRWANGFSSGAHYTWSAFIDNASEIFNASAAGEVAVAQNSFDRRNDRGRSTYDRPHRFSVNGVWELPWFRTQSGVVGHILGGWQVGGFATLQSGSPFSALNGTDPAAVLGGIDGLVGNSVRPNPNTTINFSSLSVEELRAAGGRSLFSVLPSAVTNCTLNAGSTTAGTCSVPLANRYGTVGRNVLRSDGIGNVDFSLSKSTRLFRESHKLQFRFDFFNLTNTRNFGIPEARVNNAQFANQSATDGGNRRIFLSLKYLF